MSLFTQIKIFPDESEAIQEQLRGVYEELQREGELESIHIEGEEFEYAVIGTDHISRALMKRLNAGINYGYGLGNSETGLAYVLELVPEEFRDIVAAHEYVEAHYSDHDRATVVEVERAQEEGLLDDYLDWVEDKSQSHFEELQEVADELQP